MVTDGLQNPWDVVQAPDGTLLLDERAGGFTAVLPDGTVREVRADFGDLFAEGETGLMGLALDPAFETDRRLYSCQGDRGGSIQVVAWTVAPDWSSATRTDDPLVDGLPLNEAIGRHGGCRLQFAPDGALLVGTGDTANGALSAGPGLARRQGPPGGRGDRRGRGVDARAPQRAGARRAARGPGRCSPSSTARTGTTR